MGREEKASSVPRTLLKKARLHRAVSKMRAAISLAQVESDADSPCP